MSNMRMDYGFQTWLGMPGTLYDISPYAIDSRQNAEEVPGIMQFGIGVMQGDTPGANVRVPTEGDSLTAFEGVSMGSQTMDMNMDGELIIRPHQTIGVMRWGRAWVRVVPDTDIKYGDRVFLVRGGENAGLFTNIPANGLSINAMFIGGLGTSSVAPIELYNQSREVR